MLHPYFSYTPSKHYLWMEDKDTSPDSNGKTCEAPTDFFLAESKRPTKALEAALKKQLVLASLE